MYAEKVLRLMKPVEIGLHDSRNAIFSPRIAHDVTLISEIDVINVPHESYQSIQMDTSVDKFGVVNKLFKVNKS